MRRRQLFVHSVLAWFLLFVGASVASPLLRAAELQDICSSSAGRRPALRGPATEPGAVWGGGLAHVLDCPACLPGLAPAPQGLRLADSGPLPGAEPLPPLRRPPARQARAALPARGPPALA